MKKIILVFLIMGGSLFGQKKQKMSELIDQQFNFAAKQYEVLKDNVPPEVMPKTFNYAINKVETSNTKWWTSGFYPGSLLYIYEYTKNNGIRVEAEKRMAILEKEKHYTGNHDLGFMMYCSFGNAYRLFNKAEYKATIDTSAMSLSTRYRPSIKAIQSWDDNKVLKCPVIIDNMMNLEMLCWVSDNGGDKKFKEIATTHANTTLKTHFRPDYSSYHLVDYDLQTGKIIKKITWQGLADSSAWARGQGWGLYGYTMMYRFTKDKNYLEQARKIAAFLINHPNLPEDKIPLWDYNAPNTPTQYRDASAGALIASALLELGQYTGGKEKKIYVDAAETMLRSLASDKYRAKLGDNGGFLLLHSVGHMPNKTEIDVPLTYADYYYLEALLRYKKWYL